jgi:uncharacterized protein (TIGR02594 family)
MTAYELALRYQGLREVPGISSNKQILDMLKLDENWPKDDEVAWCSAFVNFIAWNLRLPRSKSLAARSWLKVGQIIPLDAAKPGYDVVIISRGEGSQPGPTVINAPGHVGFFAGVDDAHLYILGGNQNNEVNISPFLKSRFLGIRRLRTNDYTS